MQWISKDPPLYVRDGDTWRCERDGRLYVARLKDNDWMHADGCLSMPKKTIKLGEEYAESCEMQSLRKYNRKLKC